MRVVDRVKCLWYARSNSLPRVDGACIYEGEVK